MRDDFVSVSDGASTAFEVCGLSMCFSRSSVVDSLFHKNMGTLALDGVSLSLGKGSTVSVVGESGSGKTTLVRCILGLVRPTGGKVCLLGRDLASSDSRGRIELRRRCGYVPQDPQGSLPPTLTSLEAVLEPWLIVHGRRSRAQGVKRAKELLEELNVGSELWDSRVRYFLSGGQRQRVAIARALILEPEVLFCDEPTAMQDATTRGDILKVLACRVEAGMSMLFITHDLFLARWASRRVVVLRKGVVVEDGASEEVISSPRHEYTRALLEALPRIS